MPEATDTPPLVMLVTRNFPPLVGGMEKVNRYLLKSLEPEWKLALCGPTGCRAFAPDSTWVTEAPVKPLLRFMITVFLKSLSSAKDLRPKLVMAGSGLTAPFAWLAARTVGARTAVYLHGLDIIAPSRTYQMLWLPFIRASHIVIVNSSNTAKLAIQSGVEASKIAILNPGTDIPSLDPRARARFRERNNMAERPMLLSVGRLTLRKGLAEFVGYALPEIAREFPAVVLLVIGEEATDALHGSSGSERDRIIHAARCAGVEANLRFLGHQDEADLADAYQAADCHVFPVLQVQGDVEGFGMVALEAAAHGLRTVAFDVGGVADAVSDSDSGILVKSGDYAGLVEAVVGVLKSDFSPSQVLACREFAMDKSWANFGERFRKLVRNVDG